MKLRRERVLDRRGRKSWLITTVLLMFASVSFLLTFPPTAVHGDTVALTIQAGISPSGVAVNPSTGRIYVANRGDGTISVINSATKTVVGTITVGDIPAELDRKSTRLNSSHTVISYAVFCLKKKKKN